MTTPLSTLYQLFEANDTQYRVFDMGRRVQKLSKAQFQAFEDTTQAYPYPLRGKAWLAILFWDKQRSEQHYLWFLSFALDEQGKLIQATRNHFIAMVIEILGTQLTGANDQQSKLDNNPYTFKPEQNKLAILNALVKTQMNQNASVYYEPAQNYLRGLMGWDHWQSVGLQGLADVAARLDSDENQESLLKALPNLPDTVLSPLAAMLEHIDIPTPLAEALTQSGFDALKRQDKAALINCLRAVCGAKAEGLRKPLLEAVLKSPQGQDPDLLMVITGRCWLDLKDDGLRQLFLEQSAAADPSHELFLGLTADLVAIPAIRMQMLSSFRSPERSAALAAAIGKLFGG